jgi:Platelet-activating factor acetylhydrolase, isoform II
MISLHGLTKRYGDKAAVDDRTRDPTPSMVRHRSRITSRASAAAAALVLAVGILSTPPSAAMTAAAAAQPNTVSQRLALPRPTGPYAVGRDTLHLVDHTRPDPWVPEAGARQLMVSMSYPARPRAGRPAPYLTTTEARLFLEDRGLAEVIGAETLSGTRTTARTRARPVGGRYPLVVLSPGFGVHRHTLTHLAEELASRGYVVAAVDHAYESVGTAFPGGRVRTCAACEAVEGTGQAGLVRVAEGRAQDVAFLLDQLTGVRRAWRHAELIDRGRIGMAGHSIGGSAAGTAMAVDRRVLAGVNMDGNLNGTFHAPLPDGGLDGRPFLLLGSEQTRSSGQQTWERDWPKLDGWKRWLIVTGTAHIDFSDITVLADQLGLTDSEWQLPGRRTAEIMREYVTAFFDLHLRGIPQPLLDGPTPENPEVVFHQP